MKKKVLIINWRFSDIDLPKVYSVNDDTDAKIIFTAFNNNDANLKSFIKLINDLKDINGNSEVLILTHTNHPNNITIPILTQQLNFIKNKLKIRGFEGGYGEVYYSINNQNGIIFPCDNATLENIIGYALHNLNIKKENFNYVWNYYWNELELEYQKKKFIDLYLPLHRDIKGLNEVTDAKKTAYLNEVLAEYNESYCEACENEWKEIKDILAPNNGYEVLGEIFRLSKKEKDLITSFPTVNEDLFNNYQSASKWSSQFIAIVDMLNKKIAGHK